MDPASLPECYKKSVTPTSRCGWRVIAAKFSTYCRWTKYTQSILTSGSCFSKKNFRNLRWTWPAIRLPFMCGISSVVVINYRLGRGQHTICWLRNIVPRFLSRVVTSFDTISSFSWCKRFFFTKFSRWRIIWSLTLVRIKKNILSQIFLNLFWRQCSFQN